VGIDGLVYAASEGNALKSRLNTVGIKLNTAFDPFEVSGKNAPGSLRTRSSRCPVDVAGESVKSKINRVNTELKS